MKSVERIDTGNRIRIRLATACDAERLAELSTQLGYPSSVNQTAKRLELILSDGNHAVFVAELTDGQILAWVHVAASYVVESDPEAEIAGLVVDEAHRGSGLGKLLMQEAERWAREKGLKSVYLRSNVIRKGAHSFYQRLGYSLVKTQYAFRKAL